MSEDRLILAIGRLERAVSRVEASALNAVAPPVVAPDETHSALRALTVRHDRLRQRVEGAITVLDGIIAKG